jgi:hypothetical protein
MNIKAGKRAALLIAAGFCLCTSSLAISSLGILSLGLSSLGISSPARAAGEEAAAMSTTEAAGPPIALNRFMRKSRRLKHVSVDRKPVKVAARILTRAVSSKTASHVRKSKAIAAHPKDQDAELPASIANARAELASADVAPDTAIVLSSQARDRVQLMADSQPEPNAAASDADAGVVAPDQINELDRALDEKKIEARPVVPPALTMAMAQAPAAASSSDSAWDQTSLIGKLFIGFGVLLTLASAARLFMT